MDEYILDSFLLDNSWTYETFNIRINEYSNTIITWLNNGKQK